MVKIIFLFLGFLLVGCNKTPSVKKESFAPAWINSPSQTQSVGSSVPSFQGVYMQHINAVNMAKSDIAHTVKSQVTSMLQDESLVTSGSASKKSKDKIEALSNIVMSHSYQADAYFDDDAKLFVLLEGGWSSVGKKPAPLPELITRPFDKQELLHSRCYAPTVLESIHTKSALFQDKPIWFFRPKNSSRNGMVGIAEKEEKMSFEQQKRVAIALAQAAALKERALQVKSQNELLKVVDGSVSGQVYESFMMTKSTSAKVGEFNIVDIWLDPKSCELYVYGE